jgi:hypothetical protein
MHRIVTAAAALVFAFSGLAGLNAPATLASDASSDGATTVLADLDGRPIPIADIASHKCHDFAFPRIHCFAAAIDLEAAVAAAQGDAVSALTDYAVIYSGLGFSGAYMVVSQNYDVLAIVGWNDRIRSYRGVNSGLGAFWTDWYGGGSHLDFCCNANAMTLTATFDQAISSVYRR